MKMSVCGGYDVAGDSAGGGCPHQHGKCLDGEEMHLGMCYKKCSDLTKGKYKHRVAASTCCNTAGYHCFGMGRLAYPPFPSPHRSFSPSFLVPSPVGNNTICARSLP
ncbi:unnamed protein product [Prorocentrum cordatum]|uniref:SREBP regulating gene protein n=1 Tax=Prorocentrum cordatum TaxID=2364126 RepID=A0ABN9W647_9DINO|nr:unnamed protein product [Polarella glacialis]